MVNPNAWDTYMLLGAQAYERRDFEQAREAFLGAVQAASEPREGEPDTPVAGDERLASSLNNLAAVYRLQGDIGQAISLQERSLAILRLRRGDGHPETALGMGNLGEMYLTAQRHTEAESAFLSAIEMARRGKEPQLYRQSLERLGSYYLEDEKIPAATQVYEQLRVSLKDSPSPEDLARVCHMLGNLHDSQGQAEAAEQARQQTLTILEAEWGPDSPQLAEILLNMAESLATNQRMEEAAGYAARARAIVDRFRTPTGVAYRGLEAASHEIIYLREAGRLTDAERVAREQLADPELVGSGRARLQNELGLTLFLLKRYQEAEASFRSSLSSWDSQTETAMSSRAATRFNLSSALLGQERWSEGGEELKSALSLAQEHLGREHPLLQRILLNSLEVHTRLGETTEADRVRERLEEMSRGLGP
jgi:tetratricopeptide (TPR) repeat protein